VGRNMFCSVLNVLNVVVVVESVGGRAAMDWENFQDHLVSERSATARLRATNRLNTTTQKHLS
jgi:hypothetical protein